MTMGLKLGPKRLLVFASEKDINSLDYQEFIKLLTLDDKMFSSLKQNDQFTDIEGAVSTD